ncbi:MAG: amidohydrolase family protein [Chloroflexi bacterium]|nr:amidohydrolase family protein [Chloroflexota bacterium]
MTAHASLMVVNARIVEADDPRADAVAVADGRIQRIGPAAGLRSLVSNRTELVDAQQALVVPGFHDAHCHLLSYARSLSSLDCRGARSIPELRGAIAARLKAAAPGAWLRAFGYDEARLVERRHPDRYDLDAAAPDRPVRLQHRSVHLDIFNTPGLRAVGLLDAREPGVERDSSTGEPTGRVYHWQRLGRRLEPTDENAIAADTRRATERLLSWGVTSVQDASATNGPAEWRLMNRLAASGDLGVRLFLMPGVDALESLREMLPEQRLVRRGPIKIMNDEAASDPETVRAHVRVSRAAAQAVALHTATEAELVLALDALQHAPRNASGMVDRLEHAAVVPDSLLEEVQASGAAVVGHPTWVHERGDVYRGLFPSEQHGWLHRAASFVRAGIPYAIGSDAPLAEPCPVLSLYAATQRKTGDGGVLSSAERLDTREALAALTATPARLLGRSGTLGAVRVGMLADLVLLEQDRLRPDSAAAAHEPVAMTILNGEIAWSR